MLVWFRGIYGFFYSFSEVICFSVGKRLGVDEELLFGFWDEWFRIFRFLGVRLFFFDLLNLEFLVSVFIGFLLFRVKDF